ncbi:ABC-ATPase domain-containing protein [Sediminicurvatus halobius]|uniref:Isopentenyl-diphosphate delta-isomerase n=1 Tax=Sediminicurvatus halobius TaxID=2182432 RepID=A0A2U2N025_9GAMM|nr:ABC-ATPase domain-containing protein [Spiribacter halobius]PWG62480.1 isopentenyl-diphosphate delta-isomerase [Spiribacter halobius]UEX78570.1 ABC-ATPase domain-containing protein [Spiribacter halobius]
MKQNDLESLLHRLDGRGYKAYRDLLGEHDFGEFRLHVDHVQADPFAAPSRVRVRMPLEGAALPAHVFADGERERAARDWLARRFRAEVRQSPALAIDAGAQTVLDRTAALFRDGAAELRFTVALPARGRSILGRAAASLLTRELPRAVQAALGPRGRDEAALRRHCDAVSDQVALRSQLAARGLVAFIADGAVLARRSGIDDRPLGDAVPFRAPDTLRVTLEAPHAGTVSGLGVPEGVTAIVGGGFHGKSTVLTALQQGVWDHRPDDGREQVVTRGEAVKIRAEDGRAVHGVDLSPFIDHLPFGRRTDAFHTELASGSTSQAAALQEALEAGAPALLVDEDTSATNFMIRDARMQALVAKDEEPITPFIDRVRELRDRLGVSTVLVMGGSGDYLGLADTVIQMHDYAPRDVTAAARRIAEAHAGERRAEAERALTRPPPRPLDPASLDPRTRRGKPRIKAARRDALVYGEGEVDLRALEQIADAAQVRAIGRLLALASEARDSELSDPVTWFAERLAADWSDLQRLPDGDLARPRLADLMAAVNRLRAARFLPSSSGN